MNRNQRIALAEKDLMVKDIGNYLNMNSAYITNVLSGRYKPKELRIKIAKILNKPVDFLWPKDTLSLNATEVEAKNEQE